MNKFITCLLVVIGGMLMALSGCKTQGTQAEENTAAQTAPQESTPPASEEATPLPMCTKWPSSNLCLIPKEIVEQIIEQNKVDEPMEGLIFGITPLMLAADVESVKALIDAGADVNAEGSEGNSVLMHALVLTRIMQKDDGRIQLLLDAGATIDEEGKQESVPFTVPINPGFMGYTPLMLAWTLDQVKALVEHGADVNAKTLAFELTPLIIALGNNQKEIAKYLIEHGADVNAITKDGMTPLSVAPDEETVNLLLAKGANLHPETEHGLLLANVNAGKMRALLNAGFDIHTEYFNSTPLILAKDVETAKLLIEAGYDVNAAARNTIRPYGIPLTETFAFESVLEKGTTPLDMAVMQENNELVELLLQSGAKIDATLRGSSLILTPSQKVRDLLLKNGLDVNAKDRSDRTPLNRVKRLEDAKILISAGATIDKTQFNSNLWSIADKELAQILIDQGVDFNNENRPALMLTNDPEVVKLLIKAGANIHARNRDGKNLLMRSDAVKDKYIREINRAGIEESIGAYVEAGLDVPEHAETARKAREILKHCFDDNREIIKLLIDAGADANASAYNGDTALTNTYDPETVKLLLAAGANPNGGKPHKPETEMSEKMDDIEYPRDDEYSESNNKKQTEELAHDIPIITALNNSESLKLLLAAGADPNAEDYNGSTALRSVLLSNLTIDRKRELAQILINAGADINRIPHVHNYGDHFQGSLICNCVYWQDVETLKLAVELGADVNVSCDDSSVLSLTKDHQKIKILIDAGADPNGRKSTYPPILNAYHNREILELLLNKGANPNAEGYDGKTALFQILTETSHDMKIKRDLAQMLLNAGADINHKNKKNETVITHIIRMTNGEPNKRNDNYIESLKLAIELGADVSVVCEENKPLTEQTNNQEVIKILKEAGVKC